MHYIGMAGDRQQLHRPLYTPLGVVGSSTLISRSGLCICALLGLPIRRERSNRSIVHRHASCFGTAVSAMHYTAMIYTRFSLAVEVVLIEDPVLSTGNLALLVSLSAFIICGLFLLTAIPVERSGAANTPGSMEPQPILANGDGAHLVEPDAVSVQSTAAAAAQDAEADAERATGDQAMRHNRLPYQQNNTTRFIQADSVVAVKADGHYTRIQNKTEEYFCPWPISRVEDHLDADMFLRTHRSYLVNVEHIAGFSKSGDKAFCVMDADDECRIPVSRSRVPQIKQILGLD